MKVFRQFVRNESMEEVSELALALSEAIVAGGELVVTAQQVDLLSDYERRVLTRTATKRGRVIWLEPAKDRWIILPA